MSVALLFPGQGSQHVGMGYDLYRSDPASRAVFDLADSELGFSLSSLCFEGPEEQLTDTVNQQPALYVTGVASWKAARERGWQLPAFAAGHSLGEFTALVSAGSLDFVEGLHLVRRRAELMKAAGDSNPGAMAAILALGVAEVADICARAREDTGKPVQIANDNCPGQIVISGDRDALARASEMAVDAGARKVVILPITIAAHSVLMESSASDFADAVDKVTFKTPSIPVIGNVSALPLKTPDTIRKELKAQLTSPVQWTDSMRYLLGQGVQTFVEAGPGEVLLGLIKRIDRKAKREKLSDFVTG